MARDKAKDDKFFNCDQEHEKNYVAGLYPDKQKVYDYLTLDCLLNNIKNSTHLEVYKLIERKLGYSMPI